LASRIDADRREDKVAAALVLEVLLVSVYRSPQLEVVQWIDDEHAKGKAAWMASVERDGERPVVFLLDGRFMRWGNADIDLLDVPVSNWPYVRGGMATSPMSVEL
jgi:hypothetical protein